MTGWLDKIPELGTCYTERGTAIANAKEAARKALDAAIQSEANLFHDIYSSGEWTHDELIKACLGGGMEPEVAKLVPVLNQRETKRARALAAAAAALK